MNLDPRSMKGCDDLQRTSRRALLERSRSLAALALSAPFLITRLASPLRAQGGNGTPDTLVNIFLRGAMDGLTTVVPYADPYLYSWRPTIAVQPPGSGAGAAVDLDGFFGLAPGAAPLLKAYQDGKLAFVHAVGSTDVSRSHFDAMLLMELGAPAFGTVNDGWIARHLKNVPPASPSAVLRGMAIDYLLPASMQGGPQSIPVPDPPGFDFPGSPTTDGRRRTRMKRMYLAAADPLGSAAISALDAIDVINTIDFAGYQPENGANYPSTYFGKSMRHVAAMIKASLGVEIFSIDIGGWDTHAEQGSVEGYMNTLLLELTQTLEAFYLDMQSYWDKLTLVAETEFGRRVEENSSLGTDHGHGGVMMVMGGNVNGGKVYTKWPTLAPNKLDDGDLKITIDYRDILAEILQDRLLQTDLDLVFPGYTPKFQGVTC